MLSVFIGLVSHPTYGQWVSMENVKSVATLDKIGKKIVEEFNSEYPQEYAEEYTVTDTEYLPNSDITTLVEMSKIYYSLKTEMERKCFLEYIKNHFDYQKNSLDNFKIIASLFLEHINK